MKTNIVIRTAVLLLALTILSTHSIFSMRASCGSSVEKGSSPYKVWLIVKSTDTQFWLSAFAGANAAKSEYNIDLTITGPDTEEESERQNEFIAEAVDSGADAIVFSAISYSENAAAIDAAADAGVRIVVIDSDVDSRKVNVRIGTDNVQAGRMTGAAVLDTEETELYVGIVNFDLGSRNGQEREAGLREALASDERVRAMYTVNVAATPQAAQTETVNMLREHPEINVFVGLNEPIAVGVARAVSAVGKSGEIRVVCFDTNLECVDMMRDGTVSALIAQNPYAMGYLGVECAWKLLEGEKFDPDICIDTIENYEKRITVAGKNIADAGFEDRINLIEGDAQSVIEDLAAKNRSYDMIFVDAAKAQYISYFPVCKKMLGEGGVLICDNVLFDGDIVLSRFAVRRRDRTIHARMREFLRTLSEDAEMVTTILPIGDGMTLSVKNVSGKVQ